jgi:hypothetical protein
MNAMIRAAAQQLTFLNQNWIMITHFWSDSKIWIDTAFWYD